MSLIAFSFLIALSNFQGSLKFFLIKSNIVFGLKHIKKVFLFTEYF